MKFVVWIVLALIALNAFIYAPVWRYEFVSWDDPLYVRDNVIVSQGLTRQGLIWAFTTGHAANWHPVTWLSHMLDVQLFGVSAGPQHVVNVVVHTANAILLFLLLWRMTGAAGPSAAVATMFAVHPQHVESVAWVSERKDVLSALFGLLTIWAYLAYVQKPRAGRYIAVIALFALGLMSKPMLVTLPFVLLLLDIWPLNRVRLGRGQRAVWMKLALEKAPLVAMSIASGVVTLMVQARAGAVAPLESYSFGTRAANAPVAYAAYLLKTLWPMPLAPFYPLRSWPIWWIAGTAAAIFAISILVARGSAKRHPYLLVGWLWYLGMLAPVIGLIQVGGQARADRYTYLPLVGIFIMGAWGIREFVKQRSHAISLAVASAGLVLVFAVMARAQVRHWENSLGLWNHTIETTDGNYLAHTNLGLELAARGEASAAIDHFNQALQAKPDFAEAHNALGVALLKQGRPDEAASHFLRAIQIKPSYGEPHSNLGMVLAAQGKTGEAIVEFLEGLRIDPKNADIHYNLGFAYAEQGRMAEAINQYTEAIRLNPAAAEAYTKLGDAFAREGRLSEATEKYNQALRIRPGYVLALNNLGVLLMNQGRDEEAVIQFKEALRVQPGFADSHNNLGIALAKIGRYEESVAHFTEAIRLRPGYKQAEDNLRIVLANKNQN